MSLIVEGAGMFVQNSTSIKTSTIGTLIEKMKQSISGKNSVEELVGEEFEAEDIETCEDREDTFYIYEHEPMCNFKVKLIEIDGDKAHVVGSGALIVDGYADPYKVDNFEFDSWVPIILSKEDWAKYEK